MSGERPRLLDAFCGAGGAAQGYADAGFDVVGVDIEPQPNYPFEFFQGDALKQLEGYLMFAGDGLLDRRFDAVHASPPCQAYSNLRRLDGHPDLVGPTRDLLEASGLPYVIENVVGAPLREPIMLCGSSFNLGVERHRLFECNFPVMAPPCAHGAQEKKYPIYQRGKWYMSRVAHVWGSGGGKAGDQWGEAMGIDWMTRPELKEAIPPAFTEHIGFYLLAHLEAKRKRKAAA